MNWTLLSALGVGFALGLKHALDADHLAAVAVMVGENKQSLKGSSLVGLSWGLGHALALIVVSIAVILLGLRVPERLSVWMEVAVGVVLVFLGARLIWKCRTGAVLHAHAHVHGERTHFHPHVHTDEVAARHESHHDLPAAARKIMASTTAGRRPFLVGALHGMAGSAALMLLVLTAIPETMARLAYVFFFAVGSVAGMIVMSVLIGIPFAMGRFSKGRAQSGLRLAAGCLSIVLGLFLISSLLPSL